MHKNSNWKSLLYFWTFCLFILCSIHLDAQTENTPVDLYKCSKCGRDMTDCANLHCQCGCQMFQTNIMEDDCESAKEACISRLSENPYGLGGYTKEEIEKFSEDKNCAYIETLASLFAGWKTKEQTLAQIRYQIIQMKTAILRILGIISDGLEAKGYAQTAAIIVHIISKDVLGLPVSKPDLGMSGDYVSTAVNNVNANLGGPNSPFSQIPSYILDQIRPTIYKLLDESTTPREPSVLAADTVSKQLARTDPSTDLPNPPTDNFVNPEDFTISWEVRDLFPLPLAPDIKEPKTIQSGDLFYKAGHVLYRGSGSSTDAGTISDNFSDCLTKSIEEDKTAASGERQSPWLHLVRVEKHEADGSWFVWLWAQNCWQYVPHIVHQTYDGSADLSTSAPSPRPPAPSVDGREVVNFYMARLNAKRQPSNAGVLYLRQLESIKELLEQVQEKVGNLPVVQSSPAKQP